MHIKNRLTLVVIGVTAGIMANTSALAAPYSSLSSSTFAHEVLEQSIPEDSMAGGLSLRPSWTLMNRQHRQASTLSSSVSSAITPSLASSKVSIEETLDNAKQLIGVRYIRGGTSPETGFDCSGFVGHVFKVNLGVNLPRSAKAISENAIKIDKHEMKPGDLVFFNTMRRTFSHVGIYLGDNLFVHAPSAGGKVRIEDLRERYWVKHFNGARRLPVLSHKYSAR